MPLYYPFLKCSKVEQKKKKAWLDYFTANVFCSSSFFFLNLYFYSVCVTLFTDVLNQQIDNIYGKTDRVFYRFITQILRYEP